MDTKLPVLIIGAFLLGSLPLWLYHRAMSWRWRRRFDTVERTLADNRAVTASTETTHTPPNSSSISTTTSPGVVCAALFLSPSIPRHLKKGRTLQTPSNTKK